MKKLLLTLIFLLSVNIGFSQLFTKKKILNNENFDKPQISWGYYLGVNNYDFNFDYKVDLEDIQTQKSFGFNVGIFSINFPQNTEYNLKLAEECRNAKIYFFIKDYLGYYNRHLFGHFKYPDSIKGKQDTKVSCKTSELIIGPEGNIYKCHRDLYLNEDPIGSIFDNNFKISSDYRDCNNYGECNPCDVKLKTNRFLEMGSCSVDILKKRWEREVDQITGWDQ